MVNRLVRLGIGTLYYLLGEYPWRRSGEMLGRDTLLPFGC